MNLKHFLFQAKGIVLSELAHGFWILFSPKVMDCNCCDEFFLRLASSIIAMMFYLLPKKKIAAVVVK
jgi:hypothetical protein